MKNDKASINEVPIFVKSRSEAKEWTISFKVPDNEIIRLVHELEVHQIELVEWSTTIGSEPTIVLLKTVNIWFITFGFYSLNKGAMFSDLIWLALNC
jgi:hypothetical protein